MVTITLTVFHVQHLHGKLQWPDCSPFKIDSSSRQHVPIEPISGCKCPDIANMASRLRLRSCRPMGIDSASRPSFRLRTSISLTSKSIRRCDADNIRMPYIKPLIELQFFSQWQEERHYPSTHGDSSVPNNEQAHSLDSILVVEQAVRTLKLDLESACCLRLLSNASPTLDLVKLRYILSFAVVRTNARSGPSCTPNLNDRLQLKKTMTQAATITEGDI